MIQIDRGLCVGCGLCAGICEFHEISMTAEGPAFLNQSCCDCGHCLAVCPQGAISMPQCDMESVQEYDPETFDVEPEHLLNMIRFRRSTRKFQNRSVPQDAIVRLLQAGRYSPTACNNQDVRYVVVHQEMDSVLEKLWEGLLTHARAIGDQELEERCRQYRQTGVDTLTYGCSHLIFILSGRQLNGGIAACSIELMAHAMGLGALYLGYGERAVAASPELQRYLGLSDECQLCAILCVGYPAVTWHRTVPRNALQVSWR